VTTVGYGDISATTTLGRAIAIALMIMGIGFVALLTGAIAQWLLRSEAERIATVEERVIEEEQGIADEFRAISQALAQLERRILEQQRVAPSER